MKAGPSPKPAKRSPVRILLVDDHPMIRERLTDVIQREQDLTVCGEAEDVRSALAAIERTHPDLAIVDLALRADSHGIDLIKDMRARHPEVAVLVFSLHDESPLAERVIRAGARGYITKQEATRNVLVAIRTVLAGGVYLSDKAAQQVASKVATTAQAAAKNSFDKLSDRELRVLELIGKGLATRQIAEKLHLGVPTIDTYRARIKEKLHLRDANELLQYAIRWNKLGSSNPSP
jgi:DNA-binding NarL/FixJ family response regulator